MFRWFMSLFRPHTYTIAHDGKAWAIKRSDGRFLDLKDTEHWWHRGSQYFCECWTENKEHVEQWMKRLEA